MLIAAYKYKTPAMWLGFFHGDGLARCLFWVCKRAFLAVFEIVPNVRINV